MVDKVGIQVTAETAKADGQIAKTAKELLELSGAGASADASLEELEKTAGKDLPQALAKTEKELKETNKQLEKSKRETERAKTALAKYTKQSALANKQTSALSGSLGSLGTVFGALGVLGVAKGVVTLADDFQSLENRVKDATRETGDFTSVFEELQKVSANTGSRLGDSVDVFQNLSSARKQLGTTNAEIIKVTESVQKLGVISGASTQGLQAGLLQFGQALGGGTVRAEEFNSILENIPALAQQVADGLDRTGGSVGALRKEILAGTVTSEEFFQAIVEGAESIDARFEKLPLTVAQSTNVFINELGKTASAIDQQIGLTDSLSESILSLSGSISAFTEDGERLESVINNVAGAFQALAIILGARFVGKTIAGVTTGLKGLSKQLGKTGIATNAYGQVVAKTTAKTIAGRVATIGLKTALGFLGGGIGAVISVVGLGITAWEAYNNSIVKVNKTVDENIENTSKQITEQNKLNGVVGVAGDGSAPITRDVQAVAQLETSLQGAQDALVNTINSGASQQVIQDLANLVTQIAKQLDEAKAQLEQTVFSVSLGQSPNQNVNIGQFEAEEALASAQLAFSNQYLTSKEKEDLALQSQIDKIGVLAVEAGITGQALDDLGAGLKAQAQANTDKKEKDKAQTELDALNQSLLSQEELINQSAQRKQDQLDKFKELQLVSEADYKSKSIAVEKARTDEIEAISIASAQAQLSSAGQFAQLGLSIAETFGQENTAIAKAFAITASNIQGAQAILKIIADPNIPPAYQPALITATSALVGVQTAQIIAAKHGRVVQGGNVQAFAKGGIVNTPTNFGLNGNKTGLMGEAGAEGILPLRRNSSGDLGVQVVGDGMTNNGSNTQIVVNNNNGSSVDVSSQKVGDQEIVTIAVSEARRAVSEDFIRSVSTGYGDFAETIENNYSLERR